eukprot:812096-Amphidinium_carterae.2
MHSYLRRFPSLAETMEFVGGSPVISSLADSSSSAEGCQGTIRIREAQAEVDHGLQTIWS